MDKQIKVVVFGLGPIGAEAAKLVLQKKNLKLVGGIDIDPEKVGQDLCEFLGLNSKLGTPISSDVKTTLQKMQPDIVLHSAGSFLSKVEQQLQSCLEAGASIVSSCEELFYPFRRDAEFCQRIDELAKKYQATVVGTGVNPGFAMDVLALTATSVCTQINRISVTRISNASRRRLPLQKKVGAGLTVDKFNDLVNQGKLGHIGLIESLYSIVDKTGMQVDEFRESIDPKTADRKVQTPYLEVQEGDVTGILHVAAALKDGEEIIRLELQMFVGAENETDTVIIDGEPPIHLKIEGGIFGDKATIARMINAIPVIRSANPGLTTVMDLPLASYFD